MRGAWLMKVGSWIARRETFERMVAPAIADMQVESDYGRLHRGKHYFAIGLVLVHAMLQDLRLDLASAFDAEARSFAWRRAAIWYVGSVAIFTVLGLRYNLPSNLKMEGIWSAALTSTSLEGVVTGLILGGTVAVFYLYRRSSSRRSIVPIVILASTLTIGFAIAVRPIRVSADRTLYNSILASRSPGRYVPWKANDLNEQVTRWQDIQSGVGVIPWAFIGVVLARRKRWGVAWTLAGIYTTWFLLVYILLRLGSVPPPSLIMQRWRDIALNLVVALVWLTFDKLFRRERQAVSS